MGNFGAGLDSPRTVWAVYVENHAINFALVCIRS